MASSVVGAVRVVLGLDSAAFTRGMSEAQRQLANAGKHMQAIGRQLSVRVSAPIVGLGALTLRAAGNFEAAMNQVQAVSGATEDQFAALTAQAKELGATTQYTAAQAGDAMGFLAMAGMEAEDILSAMPDTLQLAAAAQLDMARSADIVTNILAGYNMGVEQLGHATDVLVKSFTSANTDLSDLAEAMKYAGPVAQAAGVQFEEAAAALSLMGNAGIQGSMAGTSLRGAISRILNPTSAMAAAMQDAGLAFTDAQGRLLPLADIIEQLEPHADNAGLFMELFGQRAGPAMAALVTQGSDAVRELTGELEGSAGTAAHVAAVQMKGFNGAMRQLAAAFEALQLAIADSGLLQWATGAVNGLAAFLQEMSQTNPEMLRMGTIIAGLAAAIGPLLVVLGTLAGAIAAIGWPITLAVVGIGALAAAVIAFWPEISQLASVIGEFVSGAWQAFVDALNSFGTHLEAVRQDLRGFAAQIPEFFAAVPGLMLQIGVDIVMGLWDGIKSKWSEFTGWWADALSWIPGVARDELDTHSPSRVMYGIGTDIMDGLQLGISDNTDAVVETAANAAASIKDAFSILTPTQEEIALQQEALRTQLAAELAEIQLQYDQKLLLKSEYDAMMEAAHQQHADRMLEITSAQVAEENKIRSQLIGHASSIFGSLSTIMQNFGEENLAASKAFAVAAAIINTAEGITKALAQGGILGFAGAAAVAASGAAQISTILSAQKGGSGRPTVGASSGALREIPQQPTQQAVSIKLEGDYHPTSNVEQMIDELLKMQRDGYQIILDRG